MSSDMRSASHDVGFNKKHDAPYARSNRNLALPSWVGVRRRRLILIVAASIILFLFIKNIPSDLVPVGRRYSSRFGSLAPGHVQAQWGLQQMNKAQEKQNQGAQLEYEGSIMFTELAASLRPHMSWSTNKNILFALPDFASTSNLVPHACQMALHNRSAVHVALLGRQNVGVKDIISINGLSAEECPVFWHDARPDHPLESSQNRIQTSIQAGLSHCSAALRPQTILVDSSIWSIPENGKLIEQVAARFGVPLTTLPQDIHHSNWIAALDSTSLRELNNVEIDIVIQAHPESAGSLVKLLRSIERADYDGLFYPRITIELPAQVDRFLLEFLEGFKWPPGSSSGESRLVLRRRVDTRSLKAAEASMQDVESFYPRNGFISHVLLLSSDADLSSNYLHYLMFTLLEYKYSHNQLGMSESLLGISLELPDKTLSGAEPFVRQASSSQMPFLLSQTPNRNAVLFLGDKWKELHKFLALRLVHDPDLSRKSKSAASVTHEHPGWLAESVDLMQTRGYYVLYPAFAHQNDLKLVTLHRELHQSPQEYLDVGSHAKESSAFDAKSILRNDVLTDSMVAPPGNDNIAPMSPSLPLQIMLSSNEQNLQKALPMLAHLPLFTMSGEQTDWSESRLDSLKFSDEFSLQQGGCTSLENRNKAKQGSIDYLFCDVG